MKQHTSQLVQFGKLWSFLRASARESFARDNPQYYGTFNAEFSRTKDFGLATSKAAPMVRKQVSRDWRDLLRLCVDFELVLDQCRRAATLIQMDPPTIEPQWDDGAWTIYNLNHWTFEMYALLERLNALVLKVCRVVLRPSAPDWQATQQKLSKQVQDMRDEVGVLRNPLAHTGSGGVSEAVVADDLYPTALLIGWNEDVVPRFYQQVTRFGHYWRSLVSDETAKAIAMSEAIFAELIQHLPSRN